MSASNPYEALQGFVDQVPEFIQPLAVAVAGMIPYVEGEGSAALGILAGINPIVAAVAGATGNLLAVIGVVLLGSRARSAVVTRRSAKVSANAPTRTLVGAGVAEPEPRVETLDGDEAKPNRRSKGRARLRTWMVRFGVPGTSILAPLVLPTHLTAAFFVASGVSKGWVILWQAVAIVLWTGLVAAAALGLVTALGW
ncbi:small multidrug efflux protein [Herbiconiux sp. L3-i23]|uniref:small multidrug efflux protein n=1 Tax=Herbiconiux sp. L3-i23 TaxID=2905871 RepID=UPI00205A27D7|nr:small multidrug efflux protein [Herbiconiux sp. L3-i23]BDI23692.1 hypothetical protein L3i23_24680 [Herbiconiux sp. L3-i23]